MKLPYIALMILLLIVVLFVAVVLLTGAGGVSKNLIAAIRAALRI